MLSLVAAKLSLSPHEGKAVSGPNTGARPSADDELSSAVGQFDEALTSALKDVCGAEPKASPASGPDAFKQSLVMRKAVTQLADSETSDSATSDDAVVPTVVATGVSKPDQTKGLKREASTESPVVAAGGKSDKSGEPQEKQHAVSAEASDASLPAPGVAAQAVPVSEPVPMNQTTALVTHTEDRHAIPSVLLPSQAAGPSSESVAMALPAKPELKETEAFSLTLERKPRTGSLTNATIAEGSQKSGKNASDIADQTPKPAPLAGSRKAANSPAANDASGAASPLAQRSASSKFSGGNGGTEQGEKNETPSPKPLGADVRESKQSFADYSSSPVPFVKDTRAGEAREVQPVTQPVAAEKQDTTSGATKEVAIRLQNPSGETINVKLVDQGGQVQVTVRSSDPSTATSLRQDLSSLTSSLDKAGWKSDVSLPTGTSFEPIAQTRQADHDRQDAPSQRQAEWQQDMPKKRQSSSDAWDEMLTNQTA